MGIVEEMTASHQRTKKAAQGNWRAWLKTLRKGEIKQLEWTKRERWKTKDWQHGSWRGESMAPFLSGYHTPQPAHSPVCSCSLLSKGLCLPYKGDQFHSIQSPADVTFKIKCYSLMKKQSQDTECLSMPHWYPAIRNSEILVWLQSSYTNAQVKSLSVVELTIDCTVLHQFPLSYC